MYYKCKSRLFGLEVVDDVTFKEKINEIDLELLPLTIRRRRSW